MTESPQIEQVNEENIPQEQETPLEEAEFSPDFIQQLDFAEEIAMKYNKPEQTASALKQEYLEKTVLPLVLEGLSWIIRERPNDPVEHLAMFLLKNNHPAEEEEPPQPLPPAPSQRGSK